MLILNFKESVSDQTPESSFHSELITLILRENVQHKILGVQYMHAYDKMFHLSLFIEKQVFASHLKK